MYHGGGCTDGYGAAFSAWCKFGDDAEYLPMKYGDPLPPVDGRDVYVLDFSFDKPTTERVIEASKSFTWLDHHASVMREWGAEAWESQPNGLHQKFGLNGEHLIRLNNNKSGALLAWEHFHPGTEVPDLIQMIDDRDRWVFQCRDSKALHAGLQLRQPWTFSDWADMVPSKFASWDSVLMEVIRDGRTALKVVDEQIKRSVRHAEKCAIEHPDADHEHNPWEWNSGGYWYAPGLAVNSALLASEVGHELANASGTYGLVWYYDGATGRANCSLRSNGDYDVSAIAKVFGGGGHKNAAGFNVPMGQLLSWMRPQ